VIAVSAAGWRVEKELLAGLGSVVGMGVDGCGEGEFGRE